MFVKNQLLPGAQKLGIQTALTGFSKTLLSNLPDEWEKIIIKGKPFVSLNIEWLNYMFFVSPSSAEYLFWLPILLIPYYVFLRRNKDHLKGIVFLGSYFLVLFITTENSPSGLYFIQLPLLGYITPARISLFMTVLITIMNAEAIYLVFSTLKHYIYYQKKIIKLKFNTKDLPHVIIVIIIILSFMYGGLLYIERNYASLFSQKEIAIAVTEEDVAAFDWIKSHVPPNSVFLINIADAGWWLREFANRPVFPDFQLINHPEVIRDYQELEHLLYIDPLSFRFLQLMQKYNISYIYIGEKAAPLWVGRSKPNPEPFLNSPFFKLVYNRGNVKIIEINWHTIALKGR
jgi:hypothetical protein